MRKYKGYRYLLCYLMLYIVLVVTFLLETMYTYTCFVYTSKSYLIRDSDMVIFRGLLSIIIGIVLVFRENKNLVINNHVNMKQCIFRLIRNLIIIISIGYFLSYIHAEYPLYRLSNRVFVNIIALTNIVEDSIEYRLMDYAIGQFILNNLTIIYITIGVVSYEIMRFIYNIRMLKINNQKDSKT